MIGFVTRTRRPLLGCNKVTASISCGHVKPQDVNRLRLSQLTGDQSTMSLSYFLSGTDWTPVGGSSFSKYIIFSHFIPNQADLMDHSGTSELNQEYSEDMPTVFWLTPWGCRSTQYGQNNIDVGHCSCQVLINWSNVGKFEEFVTW